MDSLHFCEVTGLGEITGLSYMDRLHFYTAASTDNGCLCCVYKEGEQQLKPLFSEFIPLRFCLYVVSLMVQCTQSTRRLIIKKINVEFKLLVHFKLFVWGRFPLHFNATFMCPAMYWNRSSYIQSKFDTFPTCHLLPELNRLNSFPPFRRSSVYLSMITMLPLIDGGGYRDVIHPPFHLGQSAGSFVFTDINMRLLLKWCRTTQADYFYGPNNAKSPLLLRNTAQLTVCSYYYSTMHT